MSKNESSILLYANPAQNADMLYFCGIFIPDPFIAFTVKDKKYGVLSALEFTRASKTSTLDVVLPLEAIIKAAKKTLALELPNAADCIIYLAKEFKIKSFTIANDFPAGIAFQLQKANIKLDVAKGSIFPKREIKTKQEVQYIRAGNRVSASGIKKAESILRASKIKQGKLYYKGKLLTSEFLKSAVEITCIEQGAVSLDTIVACGAQAADPHCTGSGPIKAHELIIVDVFPRVCKTGYHGDMTRTFIKGQAGEAQKKLLHTVYEAQKKALKHIKAGVTGKTIHMQVVKHFEEAGYVTEKRGIEHVGFIHGTGHGLGLDVHEAPRVNATGPKLQAGHVVTVEPGLYYPEIGGARIEDVVLVQKVGYDKLSTCHYRAFID